MATYLSDSWNVLTELAPWLLLGAAIAGVLHVLLPSNFVERQLSGGQGVAKAVLLGVPLPLCSCGVIPTAVGLRRDGASPGATSGFLIATPQTGVDSVLVSAGLLGWPFAITKVVAALVTGVAGGLLTDRGANERAEPLEQRAIAGARPHPRDGWHHALQLLRSIWLWVIFGVLVSAALTSFVEPGAFNSLAARGTLIGFAVVLVISLPLYVCATASVPIAVGLIAAGMPTGAALVFLMAGPATNVATLGAVRATLGLRATAIYLTTIIAGSTAFGLIYEAIFGDFDVDMVHAHLHSSWWRTASAVAILALMGYFAWERIRSALPSTAADAGEAIEVGVDGMTCEGCVGTLERSLRSDDLVDTATVTLNPGRAIVHGDLNRDHLRELVTSAGFTPLD